MDNLLKKVVDKIGQDEGGYVRLKYLVKKDGKHHKIFCGEQVNDPVLSHPRIWEKIVNRINQLEQGMIMDYHFDSPGRYVHFVCKDFGNEEQPPAHYSAEQFMKEAITRLKHYYPLCPVDYGGSNLRWKNGKSVHIDIEDILFGKTDFADALVIKSRLFSNQYYRMETEQFEHLWNRFCKELDFEWRQTPPGNSLEFAKLLAENFSTF